MPIQTTETETFWRAGLRCKRRVFDLDADHEHCVVWVVGGRLGAVTLTIARVRPSHLHLTHRAVLADGYSYEAWLLARHTPMRLMDSDTSGDIGCNFLEGIPCYCDSSGYAAVELFEMATDDDNEDYIWNALVLYYKHVEELYRDRYQLPDGSGGSDSGGEHPSRDRD